MRVAIVAEWYPSPADPVLGIWAHRQAMAARDAGADVRVLAMRRPVPPLALKLRALPDTAPLRRWAGGVRSTLAPFELDWHPDPARARSSPAAAVVVRHLGPLDDPTLAPALLRLRREWSFDLVHAHCIAPPGYAAAHWTKVDGVPLAVSAHGPDMIEVPELSSLARRACAGALRRADLLMANSHWAQRRCEEVAGGPLPTRVVHLGADLPPPAEGERERPTVVTLGPPRRAQAPRRRAARAGGAAPVAGARLPDDRRRPGTRAAGAAGRGAGTGGQRDLRRPARASPRPGRAGPLPPVRDARRGGAVRRGLRGGDGRRAARDRIARGGRARGHRGGRRGNAARSARRPPRPGAHDRGGLRRRAGGARPGRAGDRGARTSPGSAAARETIAAYERSLR